MKSSHRIIAIALLFACHFASAQAYSRTIFLVRHTEPASAAPTAQLSAAGQRHAECLARTLADSDIKQIYISDSKLAQQTAAPLASKLQLTPSTMPAKDINKAVRNLLYGGSGNTLFIANGDMLPLIVQRIQAGKVSTIADNEFDRLFVITVTEGSTAPVATLRYCEAVLPPAASPRQASSPAPARKP